MKTLMPKQILGNTRKWYFVDAEWKTLGRLATSIAVYLKGKDRVDYAPHVDNGGYVIVLNAEKIAVTGNKELDKVHRTHSGFMGNLRELSIAHVRAKHPERILEHAVFGMLPKNKLRDWMMQRLKVVVWPNHTFESQKPIALPL